MLRTPRRTLPQNLEMAPRSERGLAPHLVFRQKEKKVLTATITAHLLLGPRWSQVGASWIGLCSGVSSSLLPANAATICSRQPASRKRGLFLASSGRAGPLWNHQRLCSSIMEQDGFLQSSGTAVLEPGLGLSFPLFARCSRSHLRNASHNDSWPGYGSARDPSLTLAAALLSSLLELGFLAVGALARETHSSTAFEPKPRV